MIYYEEVLGFRLAQEKLISVKGREMLIISASV